MIQIKNAFSKWMMRWRGINKIPPFYAWFVRNMRIKDGVMTQKTWSVWYAPTPSARNVQAMIWYDLTSQLLCVAWWYLYRSAHTTSRVLIWSVWAYTTPYTMFSYWDFVLILNWIDHMYIYHNLYWLYQQWTWWFNNAVWVRPPQMNDWVSSIVEAYPLIGNKITWFSIVAWNNSVSKKVLFISKPVTPDAPWRCYDFWLWTWQDYDIWENRYMSSEILAIAPAMWNIYIFCRDSIEVMWRGTAETASSIVTLSTQVISEWDQIQWMNMFVAVDDIVFFWTKDHRIRTINYAPWLTNPVIGTISDPIDDWIKMNVKSSWRENLWFWVSHKWNQQVEFHFTSINASTNYPDKVIIWDLKSQSWILDDDIAFNYCAYWQEERDVLYCANNTSVYAIWMKYDLTYQNRRKNSSANTVAIQAQYNTPNISLWTSEEKLFRWFTITWWIDTSCEITFDCYIDWTLVFTKTITDNDIPTAQKEAVKTWDPTSYSNSQKFYPFEMVCDQSMLRIKGKRIRIQITCSSSSNSVGQFYLDWLWIDALGTWNYELSDKF